MINRKKQKVFNRFQFALKKTYIHLAHTSCLVKRFLRNRPFCRINGVPACANQELLTNILRNEWNFTGYVVSDQGAIENIISEHHYYNDSVSTVAGCVNAGVNLELSDNLQNPVFFSLGLSFVSVCVSNCFFKRKVRTKDERQRISIVPHH